VTTSSFADHCQPDFCTQTLLRQSSGRKFMYRMTFPTSKEGGATKRKRTDPSGTAPDNQNQARMSPIVAQKWLLPEIQDAALQSQQQPRDGSPLADATSLTGDLASRPCHSTTIQKVAPRHPSKIVASFDPRPVRLEPRVCLTLNASKARSRLPSLCDSPNSRHFGMPGILLL
jgi:hypothetical protein